MFHAYAKYLLVQIYKEVAEEQIVEQSFNYNKILFVIIICSQTQSERNKVPSENFHRFQYALNIKLYCCVAV